MGEVTYRANLSASAFPLVSTYGGRSVIMPGPDQSYVRGLQIPQEGLIDENDKGIPQIVYCHNVMPSSQGFQSVGFIAKTSAIAGSPVIDQIYYHVDLITAPGTQILGYIAFSKALVTAYFLTETGGGAWTWLSITIGAPTTDLSAINSITSALVNGQTYYLLNTNVFYFIADPCRIYNGFLNQFNTVTLLGTSNAFGAQRIRGNMSAFGYHILWNEKVIAWSSLINPLDFVPSLITGAGFESVQDAKGPIVAVIKHQLGFIIYTTRNAVSASYTGNPLRPFIFREITGAGGFPNYDPAITVLPYDLISDDNNTNSHYAYTSAGLQRIGMANINIVHTDITDFISGNLLEDFDEINRTFSYTKLAAGVGLNKKINVILDRYLVISYGLTVLTHALVLDLITKRWGKLKFSHGMVFALQPTNAGAPYNERFQLAFANSDGVVSVVDFDTTSVLNQGVLILGKYQYTRQRLIQLQQVSLENIENNGICSCYVGSSLDGKNISGGTTSGYLKTNTTNLRTWSFHKTALNHTIYFIGGFYADTVVLKFNPAGRR